MNLLLPGHFYAERINSVDLRAGKILKFDRTRTNVAIDLDNLFNTNEHCCCRLHGRGPGAV